MTIAKRQRKMSYRSSVTVNFVYATKFCIDPPFFNGSSPRALSTAHHTSRKSQLARFPALPFFRPDITKYIALIIALKLGHVAVSKIERMIKIGFGFFTAVVFGRTDHRLTDPKRKGRSTESDCKITLVLSIRNFLC